MALIDQDLLSAIQTVVIEPVDGGAGWPSGLWSREEVLGALNQRQDRLLKLTLLHVKTADPVLIVAALQRVIDLPTDWLRTVTLVWTGNDGQIRELQRSDLFEVDHADLAFRRTAEGLPLWYTEYDPATLQVEIGPAPSVAGTLSLLYVPTGTDLTGNGVGLTVPDELSDALKYGTLADMLMKDGRGQDLARAHYGEERFQFTVELTRLLLDGFA